MSGDKYFISLFLLILAMSFVSSLPVCLDSNSQDISKVPCQGFTQSINCSGNVSAFNSTDASINFSFPTSVFAGEVRNFTLNLTNGGYELVDCANNTATILIGRIEQGYGITMFGIIFPAILLTIVTLFVSGRLFKRFGDDDEEEHEEHIREGNDEPIIPKSRLMPIVFMLFSFVPMVFMVSFVNNHLQAYLPSANITTFYGLFYFLFTVVFFFVFLLSFIVWMSSFIKMKRVMRGLDDID